MKSARASSKLVRLLVAAMLALSILATSGSLSAWVAHAEGSRDLYPSEAVDGVDFRANLEWRTSFYGPPTGSSEGFLLRRTFLQVYAESGEVLLMGSSAVGVGDGDIVLYSSDQVERPIGDEVIGAPTFSCEAQRAESGDPDQGRITSRAQELAGPQSADGTGNLSGYVPCYYEVPAEDIYYVAFYGPRGSASNVENYPSGRIDLGDPRDFDARQNTSVSAWDVTVRSSLSSTEDITGRLFADYLAMITGGSSRPVNSTLYALTTDAYLYEVWLRGLDPYGFVLYANNRGFLDSDGVTPLYHDVLADPGLPTQEQNQLNALQGGVSFARPTHKIFFNEPSREARLALNGRVDPRPQRVEGFVFVGPSGDDNDTRPGEGGTFRLTALRGGRYLLVISLDGVDFDPDNPANRTFIDVAQPGSQQIVWDGLDNAGNVFGEADNSYTARIQLGGAGEVHFPLLDVENSQDGGPRYELINAPNEQCPLLPGGCFAGFYDDRGYTTAGDTDVGTPGEVLPCPPPPDLDPPGCNPPATPVSDAFDGFDTRSSDRAFGDGSQAGFGDKKGLDLWTYYPAEGETSLDILQPPEGVFWISKAHDPDIPCYEPGESQIVNYTIAYRYVGDEPAEEATVTDTLPGATTFVSCRPQPCDETSPGVVVYSLGTLNPGAQGSLRLAVRVDEAATGKLTNTARIEAVNVPEAEAKDDADVVDPCHPPVVVTPTPPRPPGIPEPTTLALVGLGLAGVAGYARRRRQRRAD